MRHPRRTTSDTPRPMTYAVHERRSQVTSCRPRRTATVTASVRLETLSLAMRLLRWTLAVFSLM